MTTGRINQITIVRQGWPTAHFQGGRDQLLGGIRPDRPSFRGPDLLHRPLYFRLGRSYRGRYPLFPSKFLRAASASTGELWAREYRLTAPRGAPSPPGAAECSVSYWEGISCCYVLVLARCQTPTEPISRRCRPRSTAPTSYPRQADRRSDCFSRELPAIIRPTVAERSAQRCSEGDAIADGSDTGMWPPARQRLHYCGRNTVAKAMAQSRRRSLGRND